jgi:hypothetical protein
MNALAQRFRHDEIVCPSPTSLVSGVKLLILPGLFLFAQSAIAARICVSLGDPWVIARRSAWPG